MSGVSATTAVIIAAGVSAAASIATSLMTGKPSKPSGIGSAVKALGEWNADDLGLDFSADDTQALTSEFDVGVEDESLLPSNVASDVGVLDVMGDMDTSLAGTTFDESQQQARLNKQSDQPDKASGMLDFITENQELLGGVLKGVGSGISGYMQAEANKEIADKKIQGQKDLLSQKNAQIEGKWGGSGANKPGPGMLTLGQGGETETGFPTPTQKYDPRAYRSGSYQFDPKMNRIVWVPAAQ